MKSFQATITEDRAFEILEAETSLRSDGGRGDISFFIADIWATFPHLKERFPHLVEDEA